MSPQTVRFIAIGVALLHGLALGRATLVLGAEAVRSSPGPYLPLRTWLARGLSRRTVAALAIPFWLIPAAGFLWASISLWGNASVPPTWGRVVAASAGISLVGIGLFSGIWPGAPSRRLSQLDTAIAVVVDLAAIAFVFVAGGQPGSLLGI